MSREHPNPDELKECRRGAEWAAAAAAASEAGVFEALADGGRRPAELAAGLGYDLRALEIVLGVLEALGLVRRDGERVALTDEGRARYADPGSGRYEKLAARRWRDGIRKWLRLDEALRAGGLPEEDGRDQESQERFMAAMASVPEAQVRRVVERCLTRRPGAESVLDLGGGPGVHSRAYAERGLRATLFDTPETIDYVADAYDLGAHPEIELVAGDFLETLPDGPFDIILLSNITHIYDAETNAELLRRLAGLQRPGDLLAVLDFVRGRSPFAPLFAVTMLLNTERGNTYAEPEYRNWLDGAGYGSVQLEDVDEERQLITALQD